MKFKKKYIFFIILNFLFSIYVFSFNDLNTESTISFILSFLIHSCALTLGLSLLEYQKLPFVIPFALFNTLSYAVAPILVDFENFQLDIFDPENLDIFNIGFIVFYLTYFVVTYWRLKLTKIIILEPEFNLSKIQVVIFFLYLVSFEFAINLEFLHNILLQWNLGFLVYGFLAKKNNKIMNVLLFLLFVFEAVNSVLGGLIFPLFFLVMFLFLLLFLFQIRLKNTWLIVTLISIGSLYFAISFSEVKMKYRAVDFTNATDFEKLLVVKDLIKESNSYELNQEEEDHGIFWRLTYPLSALSLVRNKTPAKVGFWGGESYLPILFKFIPRILWLNKPKEDMGQIFGHRYDILADDNLTTSMNCPMVAEAYMNFGMFGMWLFFFLFALLMAIYMSSKNIRNSNNSNFIVEVFDRINMAIVAIYFLQMESNLSMFIGKIVILQVVMIFVNMLINNRRSIG
jgi:hypothetical protein